MATVRADFNQTDQTFLRLSPELEAISQESPSLAKEALQENWKKVSSAVRQTVARLSRRGIDPRTAPQFDLAKFGDQFMRIKRDGSMLVTLHVNRLGAEEREKLEAAGYQITFESDEYLFLEGWLSAFKIEEASRLDFITAIRPTLPPMTNTGSINSAGDRIMSADRARQSFGVSGRGSTVGVISDSVDGITQARASGDLPANVQVLKFGQGAGEGTAMLEIVNDLAPGANLAFYGPQSSGDMIAGINQLAAMGANVIVDDLTFFDQPHFEEGPLAQAVNAVASRGVVYLTSSGNFALGANTDRSHYESDFVGGGPLGGPTRNVHDFGGGVRSQRITVRPNSRAAIFLQWANRFGMAWDDYDLYVFDEQNNIVARGDDAQDGDDFPIEAVFIDNPNNTPATFFVVVDLFMGSPRPIELYYARVGSVQFAQAEGSIAGHANASGAITVGAIGAGDPGNDTIEPFSSQGPCTLFFPGFVRRQKPEITAIDGVAVTGAAGFPSPFFGTSAAAPHVAAIVALMLEANSTLNPTQVKNALQQTAIDFGAPSIDNVYGAGLVNAFEAVRLVRTGGGGGGAGNDPPQVAGLAASLNGDLLTLTGTASDPNGDMTQVQVNLLDTSNTVVGQTSPFPVTFGTATSIGFTAQVNNLSLFPAAVRASLIVIDSRGNRSAALTADFSQSDPGGPSLTLVTLSGNKLNLKGRGLSGQIQVEINGAVVASGFNNSNKKVKVTGSTANLNLRAGINRVRVSRNGLFSNIFLLGL
jgi:hypothetical protein